MIQKDTRVKWKFMGQTHKGIVKKVFIKNVTLKIDGQVVRQKADTGNPAYLIEHENGHKVLRNFEEVTPINT